MYRSAFEHQKMGKCVSFTRYKYVVIYGTKLKFILNSSSRVGLSENMLSKAYRSFPTDFQKKMGSTKNTFDSHGSGVNEYLLPH